MLLIDELRAEYNKLETVMNDLEAIKSHVKKALENGQYIVYSHCQEQVKMSIKLDKEFDCLLENTELAIKTLTSTTNEACGGNTFVTVDSTQVICVVKQFFPTDRLDLPFHKTMLTDIIEFTKFHLKNEMLEKAKKVRDNKGFDNIEFIKGELINIPLEDKSVDRVISNCVINLEPDKQKVYDEIYRILKDDGMFVISDFKTRFTN